MSKKEAKEQDKKKAKEPAKKPGRRKEKALPAIIDMAPASPIEKATTPDIESFGPSPSELVPYDENLLERSRTQWQFGDWESLAKLERDTLQHHPNRAKLALLAAAGHQQLGNMAAARQFTRLAQDWGCSKKLASQILIAGVHNTLGRAYALSTKQEKSLQHFENSIKMVTAGGDLAALQQARAILRNRDIPPKHWLTHKAIDLQHITAPPQKSYSHKKPYISVIIPFFNAENYLQACTNSLISQSLDDFEALFIDDGSTDGGLDKINEIARQYKKFRVLSLKSNHGPASARNIGILEAQGEFIRFMDVDDTLPEDSLEILAKHSSQQDIVRASFETTLAGKTQTDLATNKNLIDIHPFMLPMPARGKLLYGHCAALFNKVFLEKNSIRYPEHKKNAEDTTFLVDCFFSAKRSSIIINSVYQYQRHTDSLSNPVKPDLTYFTNTLSRWFYIKHRARESGHPDILNQSFESALKNYIIKEQLPLASQFLTTPEKEKLKDILTILLNEFDVQLDQSQSFF